MSFLRKRNFPFFLGGEALPADCPLSGVAEPCWALGSLLCCGLAVLSLAEVSLAGVVLIGSPAFRLSSLTGCTTTVLPAGALGGTVATSTSVGLGAPSRTGPRRVILVSGELERNEPNF